MRKKWYNVYMYEFRTAAMDKIIFIAHKKTASLPDGTDFPAGCGSGCSVVFYTDKEGNTAHAAINLTPEKLLQRFASGHIFIRFKAGRD